jgi:hypothetical protein
MWRNRALQTAFIEGCGNCNPYAAAQKSQLPACFVGTNYNPTGVYGAHIEAEISTYNDADGMIEYNCTGSLGSGMWPATPYNSGGWGDTQVVLGTKYISLPEEQSCVMTVRNPAGVSSTCSAKIEYKQNCPYGCSQTQACVNGQCVTPPACK